MTPHDPTSLAIWFLARMLPQAYLDVNVLLELSRGKADPAPLDAWLAETRGYIAFHRYHRMELQKYDESIKRRVVEFLSSRLSFIVSFDSLDGGRAGRSRALPLVFLPIKPVDDDARRAFTEGMSGDVEEPRRDATDSVRWLAELKSAVQKLDLGPWEGIPELSCLWIHLSTQSACGVLEHRLLVDPDHYSGYKLQMCVFLHRFVYQTMNTTRKSDLGDLLHCLDIPYADLVVTERSMAESLRQIGKKVPGLVPRRIETLDWLRSGGR